MTLVAAIVLLPLLAAFVLALTPGLKRAAALNVAASGGNFLMALTLLWAPHHSTALFLLDGFNIYLIILTTFVALTTSVFSAGYIAREVREGKLNPLNLRFYHAMYQAFLFTMLLALSTNNMGVMWVAVEGATLTTVLMVSLYRTPAAIEAAWKYFILCGVGIALALFGTILMYMAAQPIMGPGMAAMTWTDLLGHAPRINAGILNLAFVFLLVGYGTKVGLAPLHAWLPDAHAEGPTPISAVLSGLLLNVALYAVLRCKVLTDGALGTRFAGDLATLALSGIMLYRRRDVKRFFAYSSIEHMGLITFAFGMGGPLANFAGLLHMTMHSLTKSAIFYAVGHAVQARGSQKISDIRGLTVSHPALGWGLLFGVVAIAGLPPFGVFMSEFLLVTSTFARTPWLALPLAAGLLLAFSALIMRAQQMCFGAPSMPNGQPFGGALVPLYAHLALVLLAGLWLPEPLVAWFRSVAALLGG